MQIALNINQNELNNELLSLMKQLFQKENVSEIVVKKEKIHFEEFDSSIPLDEVLRDISKAGYSAEFIEDLSSGLKKRFIKMILLPLIEEQLGYLSKHNLLKKFQKAKELFEINIYHPSLNVEILEPKHLKLYSFKLDKKYRVVFVILNGDAKVVSITNHYK